MDAAIARRIERNVERGASALFAAAAGYFTYALLAPSLAEPILGAYSGGAAALAYLLSARTLIMVGAGQQRRPVPMFDLRKIDPMGPGELLLTDADRLPVAQQANAAPPADAAAQDDVLVLDDILEELGEDSRVVRLFSREAMPTPGQLKQRIDQHLSEEAPPESGDVSQALSDALTELRRSLR